ncbi:MAG: hypothetical protein WCJ37_07885 [Syntrophus sp. (in: bacteria)]
MSNTKFSYEQRHLQEPIKRLLQSVDLGYYNIIDIPTVMSINGGKRAIYIVDVNSEKESRDSKIIIDMIAGLPTVEQVIDVTHRFGADCKHKIIVSALGSVENQDFDIISEIAYQKVESNNYRGFYTYLVEALESTIADIKDSHDFKVLAKPELNDFNHVAPLPTDRDYMNKDSLRRVVSDRRAPETKTQFYDSYKRQKETIKVPCPMRKDQASKFSGNFYTVEVSDYWDDEGMFLLITIREEWQKYHDYYDYYNASDWRNTLLWKKMEPVINHRYAGCSVKLKDCHICKFSIMINLNAIPLFYAVEAPIQEQENLLDFLVNERKGFINLLTTSLGIMLTASQSTANP